MFGNDPGRPTLPGDRLDASEAYEHGAGRDVWCGDAQVWQVLRQPSGGNAT